MVRFSLQLHELTYKTSTYETFSPCIPVFAGLPSTDNLRFHHNFVLSFDSAKRNAKWVLEHITKESSSGQGSRANVKFFEDAGLEPRFRSRLEDYRNSGYDRGHLVRACARCVLS